jgi:hypothetical protein
MVYTTIVMHQKETDTVTTLQDIWNMLNLSPSQTKLYIVANQPNCGLSIVKNYLKTELTHNTKTQAVVRSPKDALRLVRIFLLPEHMLTMRGILSGKNDHLKQDQPFSPTMAFAHKIATKFNNIDVEITQPKTKRILEIIKIWIPMMMNKFQSNETRLG